MEAGMLQRMDDEEERHFTPSEELGFPDKNDSNKWSVSELNDMLKTHVVCDRNGYS